MRRGRGSSSARARPRRWVFVAVVVAVAASACSYQPEIYGARVDDEGTTVGLEMNNCHGDYSVSVTESVDEVRILVTDNRTPISFSGDDCADGVTVELAEPLGDRPLVNDADGTLIVVHHAPPVENPQEGSVWTPENVAAARGIWVNQLGLNRRDPEVWETRLAEICAVWNETGETTVELGDLAQRYIEEDADVSVRADGTLPHIEEGATALAQIADSPTCGIEADPNAAGAWDPTAVMAPDEIVADPAAAEPGTLVAISFPDGRMRGVHYVLEAIDSDGTVTLAYHLTSDWGGDHEPRAIPVDESNNLAIPDIGINHPGPDTVLIPGDAPPGEYRLCTGNSRHNICTPLTVIPTGSGSMEELLHHSLTFEDGLPAGEFIGEINIEDACVTLSYGTDRYLALWPAGYRLQGDRVLDESGSLVATDGADIHLGGGAIELAVAEREIGGPVPDCEQTSYWLVSEPVRP